MQFTLTEAQQSDRRGVRAPVTSRHRGAADGGQEFGAGRDGGPRAALCRLPTDTLRPEGPTVRQVRQQHQP